MSVTHTFKGRDGLITKKLSAMKLCREKCRDCSNWIEKEVKECSITDCAIYPFRTGKNPKTEGPKRKGNPDALRKWQSMPK